MKQPADGARKEQVLLSHARRESKLIMVVWTLALVWSVAGSYWMGYPHQGHAADITLILGMPAWVFWNILVPWVLCLAFTIWFCFGFMADDDLGRDVDEGSDHA